MNEVYVGKVSKKICDICDTGDVCDARNKPYYRILYGEIGHLSLGCFNLKTEAYRKARKPKNSMELLYLATRLKGEDERRIIKIFIKRLMKKEEEVK